jgi:hypothetical protein
LIENIHNQGDAAERLLDQINRRYSEALLIQEIGQAASMMQEVDQWLNYVMESLIKRLDFDRGMIMLASKSKDLLVYTVSFGYNPRDEDYLKGIQFRLDNLAQGMGVGAFRTQSLSWSTTTEIEDDLSKKSLDIVRTMGSQSLSRPIVYKGESMGSSL